MNSAFSPQRRLTLVDLIAVVLAAGLSALAFHPQCLAPIEWIGLFPFLKVLRGKTIKQGAVLGFLFGVVFHGILNWYIAVTVFRARVWFPYQLWQAVLVAGSAWVGALLICSFWSMLFGISHAALGALSARAGALS